MKKLVLLYVLISAVSANNFLQNVPAYVQQFINTVDDENNQCANDYAEAISNNTIFWKMLDASAIPLGNGFIYSSGLNFGSYDECLEIDHHYISNNIDQQLRGKFCAPFLALPYQMLNLIGMPVDDLAPDLNGTLMTLSACIPDSCGADDFRQMLEPFNISNSSLIQDSLLEKCVNVDSGKDFSVADIVVITIFGIIFFIMIISTAYDVIIAKMEKAVIHPILVAFSVYTNGKKILAISPKTNKEQLHVFHGLRFISMMWIVAGHGFAAYNVVPVMNREEALRWQFEYRYVQYIFTAPLAVDTFFFLSGFLVAYSYIKPKTPQKFFKQVMSIPYMYLHRYLRLTPALLMVYLMTISFFKHLGNGPIYLASAENAKRTCTEYWWPFFLYIQNYYNYDKLCLTQTWYLSADMQLFILSPLIMIPISIYVRKRYKLVMLSLGVLNIIFVFLPLIIKLSIPQYYNNYDMHSRLCDYSFGITLAVYMRINIDKPYPFSKKQNFIIWVFIFGLMLTTFFCYEEMILNITQTSETIFHSFMRPMWCTSLSWIVFSSHNGYGGIVNWILTRSAFQVGSRLSYCMYLLHGSVITYYVLTLRTKIYFSDFNEYYLWCGHFVTSLVVSLIWTLAFESPMIIIEKYIFGGLAPKKTIPKPKVEDIK